ncbi:MAG TPA: PfkB family carbohydrate kinase [Candidatus Limnocylindria bacterium]|nr:PfkB family carbohydrate kinase [Candidatus Limnocylindria bacterium]
MNLTRFEAITSRYPSLRLAVVGDFCLDRYFDIDPARSEISIETNLPVHNVTRVRCQPGGAGTILNNLVALGVGELRPVGFCGDDGEGWELRRALAALPGVKMHGFLTTSERHTFTYSKPLLHRAGQPPEELSRLDLKNWTPTPDRVSQKLADNMTEAARVSDGLILLDQVDIADTGVIGGVFRERLNGLRQVMDESMPKLIALADSRRGLRGWPHVIFKMNAKELGALAGAPVDSLDEIKAACASMAKTNGQPAFVTLAERGIVGATPAGEVEHVPSLPVRGPIDIVGAGDSVTANLTAALAAGATIREAMELAMAAASLVIHQLGTTGTASVTQLRELIGADAR